MNIILYDKKLESNLQRNSNIELLRILSMLMVLVLHCLDHSGALDYLEGVNYWAYWWSEALCIIAVDVFVLISGYFMVGSQFKIGKVLKIWGGMAILGYILAHQFAYKWRSTYSDLFHKNVLSAYDKKILVCKFIPCTLFVEPVP